MTPRWLGSLIQFSLFDLLVADSQPVRCSHSLLKVAMWFEWSLSSLTQIKESGLVWQLWRGSLWVRYCHFDKQVIFLLVGTSSLSEPTAGWQTRDGETGPVDEHPWGCRIASWQVDRWVVGMGRVRPLALGTFGRVCQRSWGPRLQSEERSRTETPPVRSLHRCCLIHWVPWHFVVFKIPASEVSCVSKVSSWGSDNLYLLSKSKITF